MILETSTQKRIKGMAQLINQREQLRLAFIVWDVEVIEQLRADALKVIGGMYPVSYAEAVSIYNKAMSGVDVMNLAPGWTIPADWK
jgi:hypothetical protein